MNFRNFFLSGGTFDLVFAGAVAARAQSVTPVTPQPVFSDDFAAPQLNLGKWGIQDSSSDLQRTQWGKAPLLARDADGTNFLRVPLSTFNPNFGKTGVATLGTQVGSHEAFGVGAGLEYGARIRSNNLPSGLVLGFFTYNAAGVWQDSYQKTEIDFEFLTKTGCQRQRFAHRFASARWIIRNRRDRHRCGRQLQPNLDFRHP